MNHLLRWVLGVGVVLMLGIGLGLLYLLTQATTNLLNAVNISKATLDGKVGEATSQANEAAAQAKATPTVREQYASRFALIRAWAIDRWSTAAERALTTLPDARYRAPAVAA